MNIIKHVPIVFLCSIAVPFSSMAWSVKGIYSSIFPETQKEMVQQQFEIASNGVLELHNITGNITVQARDHGVIVMEAVKSSKKREDLASLGMHAESTPEHLIIHSVSKNKTAKGAIDYNLIVPRGTTLHLTNQTGNIHLKDIDGNVKIMVGIQGNIATQNTNGTLLVDTQRGAIDIKQAHGAVKARTHSGPISIAGADHMVIAETVKSGAIKVLNAEGVIRTKTGSGNISIVPACGDVIASSLRGNIDILCKDLLPTSKIAAGSQSGHISVRLPKEVNAYVDAHTQKGKLTSDLPITFKTRTTKLNSQAWSDFKRAVEGYIGEDDQEQERVCVQLRSVKSNIKILTV